jgi:hypothetical protein
LTDKRTGSLGIELVQSKDQSNRAEKDSYEKQGTTADGFSTRGRTATTPLGAVGPCELRFIMAHRPLLSSPPFYFILFYFILFYFILFYFILFYFVLFYFILFYFILFYFILFNFILFYFILFTGTLK